MVDKKHLLTSKQMARFVTDGYLRFDEIVPPEVNQAVLAEYEDKTRPVLGYYQARGLVAPVNGVGALDEVTERIRRALNV